MEKQPASSTAENIAIHRAAEMLRPEKQRVCSDPLARHFLSPQTVARFKSPFRRSIRRWLMNRLYPGVNGAVVARVRFMDDCLAAGLQKGLEQLVVIGAGYDTRAYRFDFPDNGFRAFEVDRPATQTVKIRKLKTFLPEIPGHVTFVAMDLDRETPADRLPAAGYDPGKKTLFIMEGLVMYLAREVVEGLLTFVAEHSGKGSRVVFDYLPESIVDGTIPAREGRAMYRFVVKSGEPFRFGMSPGRMDQFLSARGFVQITNRPATDFRADYFAGSKRKISTIFSFVSAAPEDT